jgi:protease II
MTTPIANTMGEPIWNQQSDGVLYRHVNEQWRPDKIYWRNLKTEQADTLIQAEEDGGFFLSMHLSQSEEFVFLHSADHVTSEVSFLPANDFSHPPTLISERKTGHEYDAEHYQDQLLIRSNKRQANFDLFTCATDSPQHRAVATVLRGRQHPLLVGASGVRPAGVCAAKSRRAGSDTRNRRSRRPAFYRAAGSHLQPRSWQQPKSAK